MFNNESPQKLLGLPRNYTQADLQKKYKLLSPLLHPDKNLPRQKEAEAMFKVFGEAYRLLKIS